MINQIIHIALGKANPERMNGVNKVVNSIIHYQVLNGFKAELWGISFSDAHNYPNRIYRTRLFKDYRMKFRIDSNLKKELKKLDVETTVVHIHGAFIPQFYMLAKCLKRLGISYFFTPHGGYNLVALQKSKFRKKIYINLFERFVANNASKIQLLGESEKRGTEKYFKNELCLIPNGQVISELCPGIGKLNSHLLLGFIGRIDIRTKGLDILLNALKEIRLVLPVKLEVIGDGGEIAELKTLVESYRLSDLVIFRGAMFGEEKMEAMKRWDALCLVSRNEGLPGVVLEAASVGVPALVSEETNMGDYVRNHNSGWVLPENNPDEIVKEIENLVYLKSNDLLESFKFSARQMVEKEFDWNVIVKRLVNTYA